MERGNLFPDTAAVHWSGGPTAVRGRTPSSRNCEGQSTDAGSRGGLPRSSDEARNAGWSKGGGHPGSFGWPTARDEPVNEPKSTAKPFEISKWVVREAYERVKANQGAAGVDGESIEEFERNLKGNLYKIWNRMSSGTYFPPPVRAVEIPKAGGKGVRVLGVPTVSDRIAQTVVRSYLEPKVEPLFHPDSYGYRPGRSALDAVATCRERCWKNDWVIDLDLKAFFDTMDHKLVMRTVSNHTDQRWVLLYVERWLKAPLQRGDGTLVATGSRDPPGFRDDSPNAMDNRGSERGGLARGCCGG